MTTRPWFRYLRSASLVAAALVATSATATALTGCGNEIGDSCFLSSDCSPTGDRTCDVTQPEGYCTVLGCDYDTCPDEAVCVRFFVGSFANKPCDPATEDLDASSATDDCSVDERCTLAGECVPAYAEIRYCMRKCSQQDDCRTPDYECRTQDLMIEHGGEPVLAPGERATSAQQAFCAVAP
ncbi:MAG: hypothetical protein H6708_13860 [Kofleriaceae bacterium]|nr:hypothetical protein [Myxococcales bacterium]MCB9561487.1 hypothetical protein [Kofleriaceae bacterium]